MDSFQVYKDMKATDERGNLYRGSRTGSDRQINIYQTVYGSSSASEYDRYTCKRTDAR